MNSTPTRRFVPQEIDLGNFAAVAPLFDALENCELRSAAELERWLLDCSELGAAMSQEGARRYIAMTCHTDDPAIEKAYLHFVEEISPRCKPRWQALDQKFLASPFRGQLPPHRYEVYDRNTTADVTLFREANIPLQTELERLSQQFNKICGAMTVIFDGAERTMPQMARYLEETDRGRRQAAWEAVNARRMANREDFDRIYDEQIALRDRMAHNADCPSFVEYAFRMYKRFDYTPADCATFHAAVEETVVPVLRNLEERRKKALKVEPLRPWDLAVDPQGRPPLRPFENIERLCAGTEAVIGRIDAELAGQFGVMRREKLLDLDSRKGKAPGGYQYTLDEDRKPFIFMNAAGMHGDLITLFHEAGHAFHAWATQDEPLLAYRSSPIEFAEVASMSMELMTADLLGDFYGPSDQTRAARKLFEGIVRLIPWIAQIDAFQHWIYRHPRHTRAERNAFWLTLEGRLGGTADWSGYEEAHATSWQRQRHLWENPFYYIEYGIAQLGALQLWCNYRKDRKGAVAAYRRALALGGARPLPELFAAAGIRFDFGPATLGPVMREVAEELERLPEQG